MTEKKNRKGIALRLGAIAACAAVAASAVGMASFAKYHQTIGFGGTDPDGNGGAKNPRVAEFFFTGEITKNGTALSAQDLENGVSLFSTAYSGATGLGTTKGTPGNTVEAGNNDVVVAPGTHGSASIAMEAGSASDGKSHAETNAKIQLVMTQESGSDVASQVPLIFGVDENGDGKPDKFYSDALDDTKTYRIHDETGLGTVVKAADKDANGWFTFGLAGSAVELSGSLADMARDYTYYYKANGDAFYTDAAMTHKVNAGDNENEGKLAFNVTWYWAYEMTGDGVGDAVDTALALNAHNGLHGAGLTEAQQAAAKAAAEVKVTFAAEATQLD